MRQSKITPKSQKRGAESTIKYILKLVFIKDNNVLSPCENQRSVVDKFLI
jgi:hypothetical protein